MPGAGGTGNGPSVPSPSTSTSSSSYSYDDHSSGKKWIYTAIAVIVILGLGGGAYYMLGMKKTSEQPQETTTKLPKPWLSQYFNTEVCNDQKTCGDSADPEKDGLSNVDEFRSSTNPLNPDTDTDGLADGDEANIYKTDPNIRFTDRRETVAQNNWTDGVQIKNGYDPLTPALPFTEARKKQIADDTVKFKLHEPTTTTLSVVAPSAAVVYTNSKYAFSLTMTSAWKGFQVYTSEGSQGVGSPTYLAFSMPTSDTTKSVTDATSQVKNYSDIFTIVVIGKDKKYTGTGIKIGEDSTSVFYYTTNANLPTDLKKVNFEIPKVIASFKLTSTDLTTSWKTYSNTTTGFEFKYPSNYAVSTTGKTNVAPFISSSYVDVQISNYTTSNSTNTQNIIVGGVSAVKHAVGSNKDNGVEYQIDVPTKKITILFNGKNSSSKDKITEYDQILSTFKFTK
ncbi:MAG: hypothetical protein KW804_02580 [Candidatus Doudnabacteria bacterium]|nr:hypothetical protein [Candidatus Doudnabacteria bacterium]